MRAPKQGFPMGGPNSLTGARSRRGTTSLTELADYLAYALVHHYRDAESLRAKWCSPILRAGGGSGYGRIQTKARGRRVIERAKDLFRLGDQLPRLLSRGWMKSNSDFQVFDEAMDTILRADPKAVKAAVDADIQSHTAERDARGEQKRGRKPRSGDDSRNKNDNSAK